MNARACETREKRHILAAGQKIMGCIYLTHANTHHIENIKDVYLWTSVFQCSQQNGDRASAASVVLINIREKLIYSIHSATIFIEA